MLADARAAFADDGDLLAVHNRDLTMAHTRTTMLLGLLALAAACACDRQTTTAEASPMTRDMLLESPAFADGKTIPSKYTCEGEDLSPELRWSNAPEGTQSFALIVDDPDAPDPKRPKRTWVHWVLYEIPRDATRLPEAARPLPPGTREGTNDWGRTGYGGPCPPIGEHRYFFKLYALDVELGALSEPTKAELEEAMYGHVLGKAELMGTYEKHKGGG
jgi:Raf kinase inhibitor-like YbhB/YbcL family protein